MQQRVFFLPLCFHTMVWVMWQEDVSGHIGKGYGKGYSNFQGYGFDSSKGAGKGSSKGQGKGKKQEKGKGKGKTGPWSWCKAPGCSLWNYDDRARCKCASPNPYVKAVDTDGAQGNGKGKKEKDETSKPSQKKVTKEVTYADTVKSEAKPKKGEEGAPTTIGSKAFTDAVKKGVEKEMQDLKAKPTNEDGEGFVEASEETPELATLRARMTWPKSMPKGATVKTPEEKVAAIATCKSAEEEAALDSMIAMQQGFIAAVDPKMTGLLKPLQVTLDIYLEEKKGLSRKGTKGAQLVDKLQAAYHTEAAEWTNREVGVNKAKASSLELVATIVKEIQVNE